MAAFLQRAFKLPEPANTNRFQDTRNIQNSFRNAIAAIAARGITLGCDAAGTRFCPNRPVTRAQTAAFLTRALKLPIPANTEKFTDTMHNTHRSAIAAVTEAGITLGCNAAGTRFCPNRPVTRAQTAAFLTRALKL